MKKITRKAVAVLLSLTVVLTLPDFSGTAKAAEEDNTMHSDTDSRIPSYNNSISYEEYLEQHENTANAKAPITIKGSDYAEADMEVAKDGDNIVTSSVGSITWEVEVPEAARYEMEIVYSSAGDGGTKSQMSMALNGEIPFEQVATINFHRMYMDADKDYKTMEGNQSVPSQIEYVDWQTMSVQDDEGYYQGPLQFCFEKGVNTITLSALMGKLIIKSITLKPVTELKSYEEYLAEKKADGASEIAKSQAERIQAEDAYLKSSPTFRPENDRTSAAMEPYDPTYIVLNTIGGSSWSNNGDWIEWQADVPEAGLYKITTRAKQDENTGFSAVRTVSVNGEVPFTEATDIRFVYDSKFNVSNLADKDGNELYFYFDQGMNTIRMTCSLGEYSDIVVQLEEINEYLSSVYQAITAITSTSPNSYQDYQLTTRLPSLTSDLQAIAEMIQKANDDILTLTGSASDVSATLERCRDLLVDIAESPSKIQSRVTSIADNITSLGSAIITLSKQPLTLDWIQLSGSEDELPKAEAGIGASIKHELLAFVGSFTNDYSVTSDEVETSDKDLTVWISTGRDQMEVIRRLVNESFSKDTGIPVNIKLVDASIILTAIAAGSGPDVAIGVSSTLPMELAFRGAAYDLTQFSDFGDVRTRFLDAAVECFEFEDKYYALPDQMSYSVMFYRKDILAQYGIAVPETWDDLISIIPTLATYNMQAYLDKDTKLTLGSVAGVGSYTAVNSVYLSMLYQSGGELYNEEGTKALLDSAESVNSFKTWIEFYTKYGFSTTIDFVTRFRLGSVPIAIMDISNYNTLSISAPEINGKWSVALVPGTRQADGTVDHSTPVTTSAAMIIKDSVEKKQNENEAWEFIKWWTTQETQTTYAEEMEAVLGSSGRYMVSNLDSFERVSWSSDVATVLNNSLPWLREVRQIPGCYLTGRNLSNAYYYAIANTAEKPIDIISEYNETLNSEILKKRSEFGLD